MSIVSTLEIKLAFMTLLYIQWLSSYLNEKHRFGRDFHVMTEFEVRQEHYRLCQAHCAVCFKRDVCKRSTRIHVADYQLRYHIQSGLLHKNFKTFELT